MHRYEGSQRLEQSRRRDAAVASAQQHAAGFDSWEEHQAAKFGVASWQADDAADACALCAEPFHRWTRRRHHCRLCGRLVCNPCSRSRRLPSQGSHHPQRACDECAQRGEDADHHERSQRAEAAAAAAERAAGG